MFSNLGFNFFACDILLFRIWDPTFSNVGSNFFEFGIQLFRICDASFSSLTSNFLEFGIHLFRVWHSTFSSLASKFSEFGTSMHESKDWRKNPTTPSQSTTPINPRIRGRKYEFGTPLPIRPIHGLREQNRRPRPTHQSTDPWVGQRTRQPQRNGASDQSTDPWVGERTRRPQRISPIHQSDESTDPWVGEQTPLTWGTTQDNRNTHPKTHTHTHTTLQHVLNDVPFLL